MSELSTPTVGLQVQSQKAEMRPGPQVDVSGAMRGQPDWQSLGEAGRNLGQTVTNLFNDTAAKSAFLEYQKELGDIERNYINSNGNGSPEEIRKVQDLTNKAWSKFQQSTRNLAGSNTYKIIEEANKYGVRFRDSILNNRAKFAEDYYQKNQAALVATNTEDYVFAADDPNSEAFVSANAELERNLTELLVHNGFNTDDPLFKKTMADAKSAAILSNIKYHVANKDYTKGWRNYNHYIADNTLYGEDRTTALSMLQILKDEVTAASASSSSGSIDNILYNQAIGKLDPQQKAVVTGWELPRALADYEQLRNAERARRSLALDVWLTAKKNGGEILADQSIRTKDGGIIEKVPEMSRPKSALEIFNEVYHKVDMANTQAARFNKAGGQSAGRISLGLIEARQLAEEASKDEKTKNALADFEAWLKIATPEQLVIGSKAFSPDFAAQVVGDLQQIMGDKEFSDYIEYLRYGVVRNSADYAAQKISAERMTFDEFLRIQQAARVENISEAAVISRDYGIPLHPANDVYVKLLEFYSDRKNTWGGSKNQHEFLKNQLPQGSEIFASAMGVEGTENIKSFAKMNERQIQDLMVAAYNDTAKNNPKLIAFRERLAKEKNDKPEDHMHETYELMLHDGDILIDFQDRLTDLVEDYAYKKEEELTGRPAIRSEQITLYNTTFTVPTATPPELQAYAIDNPTAFERWLGSRIANPNINMLSNFAGSAYDTIRRGGLAMVQGGGAVLDNAVGVVLNGPPGERDYNKVGDIKEYVSNINVNGLKTSAVAIVNKGGKVIDAITGAVLNGPGERDYNKIGDIKEYVSNMNVNGIDDILNAAKSIVTQSGKAVDSVIEAVLTGPGERDYNKVGDIKEYVSGMNVSGLSSALDATQTGAVTVVNQGGKAIDAVTGAVLNGIPGERDYNKIGDIKEYVSNMNVNGLSSALDTFKTGAVTIVDQSGNVVDAVTGAVLNGIPGERDYNKIGDIKEYVGGMNINGLATALDVAQTGGRTIVSESSNAVDAVTGAVLNGPLPEDRDYNKIGQLRDTTANLVDLLKHLKSVPEIKESMYQESLQEERIGDIGLIANKIDADLRTIDEINNMFADVFGVNYRAMGYSTRKERVLEAYNRVNDYMVIADAYWTGETLQYVKTQLDATRKNLSDAMEALSALDYSVMMGKEHE